MLDANHVGDLSEKELRALIAQLQTLSDKYKRAEKIQKALFDISELASSVSKLDRLYKAVHSIVGDFVNADNFYVAFHNELERNVDFVYFVDERDTRINLDVPYEKVMEGITGYILKSGESLVMTQENINELVEQKGIVLLGSHPVDFIGVPLKRGQEVIGAMVVQSYNNKVRYNRDDFEVISFISQHIVTTVDRVKSRELTEKTIRQRTKQLRKINQELQEEIHERQRVEALQKALFEISELSVSHDDDMHKFYTQLHAVLNRLISAPNCYIAVLDKSAQHILFPYFNDENQSESPTTRPLDKGLTEYVLRKGEASLIDKMRSLELAQDGEINASLANSFAAIGNSWLGAPLSIQDTVIGVIAVQTYGKHADYNVRDLELLRFVSRHIGVAMERRKNAEHLREYSEQLSHKVQQRTDELHKSNEDLKSQIEQRKEIEQKLLHDAHHDTLTDLPNRAMFNSRLELAIANKRRHPDNQFAVLFVDLDRFKNINDTLGHHAGDEFLVEVAKRINSCKRSHDLLARLGGDEFVLLVDSFDTEADIEDVAHRIIRTVSLPFMLDGKEMYSGASIGVAHLNMSYRSANEVLRDADAAMYQAKNLGRGRFVTFDKSMREQLLDDAQLETDFRQALKDNAFSCELQPVCHLKDQSILYYDCTFNWAHESLGEVGKVQFWSIVEQCGLTAELNRSLLQQVCKILTAWKEDPEKSQWRIGVSLSIEHLMQTGLVAELSKQVKACGFPPERLLLEFSESALANRAQYLIPSLKKLKRQHFGLVLDGFGSGAASLNYLFSYPYDYLKIDEKFVHSLTRSNTNHRFVEAIVMVAQKAELSLIAEGIDLQTQLQSLNTLGCEYGQGTAVMPSIRVNLDALT